MKIFVKAKPASNKVYIKKIDALHYLVAVKEPPVQDRANRAITNALAKYFNVPPYNVSLISGYSSKQKIFEVLSL